MQFSTRFWYQPHWHIAAILLLPFAGLFAVCLFIRRWLYRLQLIKIARFPVPIIVVGNITVGGTGKTPLVIYLVDLLKAKGYEPGIVSRGIGGRKHRAAHWVTLTDSPAEVGDEALLLAKHAPLMICIDRAKAVRELLLKTHCNIIISDDGLQHYRLGRDMEIALIDGERYLGNRLLLPAGPLRETAQRLQKVDFVITNGTEDKNKLMMKMIPHYFISLQNETERFLPKNFPHKIVHAVAGIGHPERFFKRLRGLGLTIIPHVFPDHYQFSKQDLNFNDELPIVMTEKDAVKCRYFPAKDCWFLTITVTLSQEFDALFHAKLITMEKKDVKQKINEMGTDHHFLN